MTNEQIPQTPAERIPDGQGNRILELLGEWLKARRGRSVAVELSADGWRATLSEPPLARTSGGASLADALAQVATVAGLETDEAAR